MRNISDSGEWVGGVHGANAEDFMESLKFSSLKQERGEDMRTKVYQVYDK